MIALPACGAQLGLTIRCLPIAEQTEQIRRREWAPFGKRYVDRPNTTAARSLLVETLPAGLRNRRAIALTAVVVVAAILAIVTMIVRACFYFILFYFYLFILKKSSLRAAS